MTTSPKPTKDEALDRAEMIRKLNAAATILRDDTFRQAAALLAADDKAGGEVAPTEAQFVDWCERHGMQHADREAFFDAASLYLDYARPQPQAERPAEQRGPQ